MFGFKRLIEAFYWLSIKRTVRQPIFGSRNYHRKRLFNKGLQFEKFKLNSLSLTFSASFHLSYSSYFSELLILVRYHSIVMIFIGQKYIKRGRLKTQMLN